MKQPHRFVWLGLVVLSLIGFGSFAALDTVPAQTQGQPSLALPDEERLMNIRQLTFGGENAEAYFSGDEKRLIFQTTRDGHACDQIFTMKVDGSDLRLVSNGKGRTTCAYFFPNGQQILYSSTHHVNAACPPRPDYSKGYVWALYDYEIFTARPDGSQPKQLTNYGVYTTEATISPDGKKIVFTSLKDGDLDLYTMDADGRNVKRLTTTLGYDGGAFFSADGKKIVYRAYHPQTESESKEYKELIKQKLVRPSKLDIFVMNADGTEQRRVTNFNVATFAPFMHPDGKRIIFSSNLKDPRGRNFDLYMVNLDGSGLERITYNETFDGFPMFTRDGKRLVFASNRKARTPGETNVFIADWRE